MLTIKIASIGEIDAYILRQLILRLKNFQSNSDISILDKKIGIPNDAYNSRRKQWHSGKIINHVYSLTDHNNIIIGIINNDIYTTGITYIYGEAQSTKKIAIISLKRISQNVSSKNLILERLLKEVLHELGHINNLKHCENDFCVMYFSTSIAQIDSKKNQYCELCNVKLLINS